MMVVVVVVEMVMVVVVVVVIAELLPTFCMHPLKAWTGGSKGERIERSDTPPIQRCWI